MVWLCILSIKVRKLSSSLCNTWFVTDLLEMKEDIFYLGWRNFWWRTDNFLLLWKWSARKILSKIDNHFYFQWLEIVCRFFLTLHCQWCNCRDVLVDERWLEEMFETPTESGVDGHDHLQLNYTSCRRRDTVEQYVSPPPSTTIE